MANKRFGHVGDGPSSMMMSQVINPMREIEIPNFDQAQVDYLLKVFPEPIIRAPSSQDELVAAGALVALRDGQRSIINHIQALIDARKASS